MASLWQKEKSGIWYVTYREENKQKVRSLRKKKRTEALRLVRSIDSVLEEDGAVSINVTSGIPTPEQDPPLDEFWLEFRQFAERHRAPNTVKEYENWFTQLREFSGAGRLGDISPQTIEAFKRALLKQGKHKGKGVGLGQGQHQLRLENSEGHLEPRHQAGPVHRLEPPRARGAPQDSAAA